MGMTSLNLIELPPLYGFLPNFEGALCAQVDSELFFPEQGRSASKAKKICSQCPVLVECRSFALEHSIPYGIWGGMTVKERQDVRKLLYG